MALKSKKAGFVYKPRSMDQVKGRANRKTSKFDSIIKQTVDTYRPKPGDNLYRYCPPTWNDADHYGFTAWVHQNIGSDNSTYLCLRKMLNKPCPCCEASKEAKDAGETEEAKELAPKERVISYVLDRDGDDPDKPLVYDQSWTQDRDITSLCVNERSGEILMIDHPDKGYDVTIKRSGTGMKTKYYGYAIAREDSPLHDSEKTQDEILDFIKENPIPDILNYYDYDYIAGMLSGKVAEKDEALDKEQDEETTERTARPKNGKRAVEEDPPFDEPPTRRGPRRDQELDPAEEEEEEAVAPRRAASSRRAPVEEVEDEEAPAPRRRAAPPPEEDEEPAPRRASSRSAPPPDEEEAPPPRRRAAAPPPEEEDEAPPPRRRAAPVDEEVNEEDEAPPPRRAAAGRTRIVEEDPAEEDAPPPRRSARR